MDSRAELKNSYRFPSKKRRVDGQSESRTSTEFNFYWKSQNRDTFSSLDSIHRLKKGCDTQEVNIRFFWSLFISLLLALSSFLSAYAAGPIRKVVIVSASFGAGHNSSANSIKAQLEREFPGVQVKILYAENYMSFGLGKIAPELFDKVYQNAPEIYDRMFQNTMRSAAEQTTAATISTSPFRRDRLLKDLMLEQPDAVISTHHYSTAMLIRLREEGAIGPENFPIAWVDTDFVHEPFFYLNSLGIEKTFMAHPGLTEERIKIGIPASKMATTGLPISATVFEDFSEQKRADFMTSALETRDRSERKGKKGESIPAEWPWVNGETYSKDAHPVKLDPEVFTVTLASGGSGLGDYPTIFESVLAAARTRGIRKIQFIAACGVNEKNYKGLKAAYQKGLKAGMMDGVTLAVTHGVDNAKLMRYVHSSAIFIGKSGSQSPIEAAIMDRPSVLLDVLGGQEHHTALFFKNQGLASVVTEGEQASIGKVAFEMLEDRGRMEKMRNAQAVTRKAYDMDPIRQFVAEAFIRQGRDGKIPLDGKRNGPVLKFLKDFCSRLFSRDSR